MRVRGEIAHHTVQVSSSCVDDDFTNGEHFDQQGMPRRCEGDAMHALTARGEHAVDEFAQDVKVCRLKRQRVACVEFDDRFTVDRPPLFDRRHAVGDNFEKLPPMTHRNHTDLCEMEFVNESFDKFGQVSSVELKQVRRQCCVGRMINCGEFDR